MEGPERARTASRGDARAERKGSERTGRAPPGVGTRGDDASSRRASSGTARRARVEPPADIPAKRSAGETPELPNPSRDRARAAALTPPPGRVPSPRMTHAAQVLREAKALMRELSPRNDGDADADGDVRPRTSRFLQTHADDADALDVANTGGRWRSLRAPAEASSRARARLEAEAEDERAFAARRRETSRARVFAAIAAAAPPRGPFAEDDFGASRLVARTGALRAASAAAAAAAAAARGWRRPEPPVALRERLAEALAAKETNGRERPLSAAVTSIEADAKSDAGRTIVARSSSVSSADAKSSAKLAAANAAREKAAREIAAAERERAAAARRRVVAEAALVAERDAAAAARARKLARAEAKEAESCALRAEKAALDAARRRTHRQKRFAFAAWRSAAADAARARDVAGTRGAVRMLVRKARRALRRWALAAAATRAREESAAAERAAAMELEMARVAETWRASKLVAASVAAWREAAFASGAAAASAARERLAPAEETLDERATIVLPASPPSRVATETQTDAMTTEARTDAMTTETRTDAMTPSRWGARATAFSWNGEGGAGTAAAAAGGGETRRDATTASSLPEEDEDAEEDALSHEAEAADAADATRDASEAARDSDDPEGAEELMRRVAAVRETHAELRNERGSPPSPSTFAGTRDTHAFARVSEGTEGTERGPAATARRPEASEACENPWARSPPERRPETDAARAAHVSLKEKKSARETAAEARSAARAAARDDLRARAAAAREASAARAAARAAEEGEIERALEAARTAEILATRHAAAAKKAAARRAAVIAAESLALAAAHFDHQLLRRRGLAPWRTYAVYAAGAAAEAATRGWLAPARRAAKAWHARVRLRLSRRAYAVARLASVRDERAAGDVWFAWRAAAAASVAATRRRARRAFAALRETRDRAADDQLTATACRDRTARQRGWRAWVEAAGAALAAARARRARDAVAAAERRARAALGAWRAGARLAAEARRKAEAKDALFSKVGVWLEEMRGGMCALTPGSEGSESSRSSPASREARRARFYAARGARAGANAAASSPSPSRVSPEDEPRCAQRAPTPSSSPIRGGTPVRPGAWREWSPEETPARVLSMPSPTPKKSPKKSPKRTYVDSDARLLAFLDDGFADENDVSSHREGAFGGGTRSPADSPGARSDWLRLDDVTPPDVSLLLRRERDAIGADAARSEARLRKFRSRALPGEGKKETPLRRITELARPKSKTPPVKTKTLNPPRETDAAPAGYSAATRARLKRLAAKKRSR